MEHKSYPKIVRINKIFEECTIVEKIDGTNSSLYIDEHSHLVNVGSRNRLITPLDDNFGFAKCAVDNKEDLEKLGPGVHYGEWYGSGIQRRYGLKEKRFALFNYHTRTPENTPDCCEVIKPFYVGEFSFDILNQAIEELKEKGSFQVPGFMNPEGVIVHLLNTKRMFKWTFENNEGKWKGVA